MNKQDIIRSYAEKTRSSHYQATKAVDALLGIIGNALAKGESITIPDFGKFHVKTVKERIGVNPATKERIVIPEHTKVCFKPYENIQRYSFKYQV